MPFSGITKSEFGRLSLFCHPWMVVMHTWGPLNLLDNVFVFRYTEPEMLLMQVKQSLTSCNVVATTKEKEMLGVKAYSRAVSRRCFSPMSHHGCCLHS